MFLTCSYFSHYFKFPANYTHRLNQKCYSHKITTAAMWTSFNGFDYDIVVGVPLSKSIDFINISLLTSRFLVARHRCQQIACHPLQIKNHFVNQLKYAC